MGALAKLGWYARRLSRMSPAEIVFRSGEQVRRWSDGRRFFNWDSFNEFDGPLHGLPGLDLSAAAAGHLESAVRVRDRLLAGDVAWLGQQWPLLGDDWLTRLWTLDPVSGGHWPGAEAPAGYRERAERGDVKFVWEPNRLQMLQPLALLARRGDATAEELGWNIIRVWMDANTPYRGVNWSSGIEAASRLVSVLCFVAGLRDVSEDRSTRLRRFLAAHTRFLSRYPSLHSSANNHRVAELASLLLAHVAAPQLPHAKPSQILADLETEILRQFHPDGVGAEQSPTYAAYSLEWFTLAAVAAEQAGMAVSQDYRARLAAAADHLSWLLDDSGRPPRIGDDDEGRVLAMGLEPETHYPLSVIAMTARYLGQPAPAQRDLALRDLIKPGNQPRTTQPKGQRLFDRGGYTIVRSDTARGQSVLTVDHGPLGFLSIAAHGHADSLAITLSWGDEPVLVDAGTYLYHAGGKRRGQMRGTPVHNTLSIEGADQSRIVGPFAWAEHATTVLHSHGDGQLTATCNGWLKRFGVVHQRRVDWRNPARVVVEDRLIGKPLRSVQWSSGLSLALNCEVQLEQSIARIQTSGGRRLVLRAIDASWQLVRSPYSAAFNKLEEVDRLELRGTISHATHEPVAAFAIELEA